jgi:hypothetical protein
MSRDFWGKIWGFAKPPEMTVEVPLCVLVQVCVQLVNFIVLP